MEFVPLVAALALALKIVDLAKYAMARDVNSVVTQLVTWVAGVVVILLLAQTDFASGISIGDLALSEVNLASQILLGLTVAASGSVVYDFKKAVDRTDSARTPSLMSGHVADTHVRTEHDTV